MQGFFRLDFLFSGLEVNTFMVFMARLMVLLVFGGGALYAIFKISVKALDCVQALLSSVGSLPGSFYLLILLVIPLSPNSLIADWIGYILLTICLLGLATFVALAIIMWKYGVESLVGLIRTVRDKEERHGVKPEENLMGPENVVHTTIHEAMPASQAG